MNGESRDEDHSSLFVSDGRFNCYGGWAVFTADELDYIKFVSAGSRSTIIAAKGANGWDVTFYTPLGYNGVDPNTPHKGKYWDAFHQMVESTGKSSPPPHVVRWVTAESEALYPRNVAGFLDNLAETGGSKISTSDKKFTISFGEGELEGLDVYGNGRYHLTLELLPGARAEKIVSAVENAYENNRW